MTERDDPRELTEEAAAHGRFPDEAGDLRDDSTPVNETVPADEVRAGEEMRPNEAVPLEDDLPGVVVTPPSDHNRDPDAGQPHEGLDPGVERDHLRSASQGVRPEQS